MTKKLSAERNRSIWISRITICISVGGALASYFWHPVYALQFIVDALIRTYLHFVAGAMAHEGAHGHLANSRSGNRWWGRIALMPTMVPEVIFRKTHLHHHAFTNEPGKDPDEFLNTKHSWEIPFRALALPYYWVYWMWKEGRLTRSDRLEYILSWIVNAGIYSAIAIFAGLDRVILGFMTSAVLHSILLWYFFAIKTHEGYFTGMAAARSHNYYGRPMFWFSFGLSMHRLHHMKPQLAWLQMLDRVPTGSWAQTVRFGREILSVSPRPMSSLSTMNDRSLPVHVGIRFQESATIDMNNRKNN